ncbi:MAG: hypothetical protein JKY50_19520 [Oleispira sp.]|nr:hypothetical protein [Oleispira sp.]MBL4880224.1 hypothetical protein [Oleispira sp.]
MKCSVKQPLLIIFGITLSWSLPVWAHQPVMDMAPRWQNGYGFQVRQESHRSDKLVSGESKVDNPLGRDNEVNTTWLEGIYTFKRELRLSLKVPYLDQQRTVIYDGSPIKQSGKGLGDAVVGLLLKRYTNQATATGNIAITPSIRLPTGSTSNDYPVGDGSTDLGISFSASWEKSDLYQYYDLFYWKNQKGRRGIKEGDEIGFDTNIGWHPYHNNLKNQGIFVMIDGSARYQERGHNAEGVTGGQRLSSGPVFVYYQGGMMFRAEYKYPLYEDLFGTQVSRGAEFNVGMGFVY